MSGRRSNVQPPARQQQFGLLSVSLWLFVMGMIRPCHGFRWYCELQDQPIFEVTWNRYYHRFEHQNPLLNQTEFDRNHPDAQEDTYHPYRSENVYHHDDDKPGHKKRNVRQRRAEASSSTRQYHPDDDENVGSHWKFWSWLNVADWKVMGDEGDEHYSYGEGAVPAISLSDLTSSSSSSFTAGGDKRRGLALTSWIQQQQQNLQQDQQPHRQQPQPEFELSPVAVNSSSSASNSLSFYISQLQEEEENNHPNHNSHNIYRIDDWNPTVDTVKVRPCGCWKDNALRPNPYYCPLQYSHCALPSAGSSDTTTKCVNVKKGRRFARTVWPVLMLWYIIILCLFFTARGRHALGCCCSVFIPKWNSFVVRYILRTDPDRASHMILTYMTRRRRALEQIHMMQQQQPLQQQNENESSSPINNNDIDNDEENTNDANATTTTTAVEVATTTIGQRISSFVGRLINTSNDNNVVSTSPVDEAGLLAAIFGDATTVSNTMVTPKPEPTQLVLKTRIFYKSSYIRETTTSTTSIKKEEEGSKTSTQQQQQQQQRQQEQEQQQPANANHQNSSTSNHDNSSSNTDNDRSDDVVNTNDSGLSEDADGDGVSTAGENDDDTMDCTICQIALENGDRVGALPCSHTFHVYCLKGWLVHRNVCPLCLAENVAEPQFQKKISTGTIGTSTSIITM